MSAEKSKAAGSRSSSTVPAARKRVKRLPHGSGREALLEAVVRSVAREGSGGFSNRQVAGKAGLTQGLIHYHFGSRDKMLAEAYKWALARGIESTGIAPSRNWLEDWGRQLAQLSRDDAELHIFMNEAVLDACRRPDHRKLITPLFEDVFAGIADALRAAGVRPTPALARVIFAAIAGLTLQHLVFRSNEMAQESAAELARILKHLEKA